MVTKWQYKVVRFHWAKDEVMDEKLLNSLGDEGWNLVSVTDYGDAYRGDAARSVEYLKKEVARAESGPP